MANKVVLADTSVLIDFFRKSDKSKSVLVKLLQDGVTFCISSITEFEIYTGATSEQIPFWESLLAKIEVLPFDQTSARIAVEINSDLKKRKKQIAIPDLFIAAIAKAHNLPVVTLNRKHFQRIEDLVVSE